MSDPLFGAHNSNEISSHERIFTAMPPPIAPITQYKDVRSLVRGLNILKALNSAPGGISTTSELAEVCGIHRTTVKRILETLRAEGFIRRGDKDGQYYLTFEVRRLSEGFVEDAWIQHVASPLMQASVREVLWPCDLCTIENGFMVVRESTHRWSILSQHRAMIGEKMPMFVTAQGRSYLACCSDEERENLLAVLGQRTDWIGAMARDHQSVSAVIAETRQRGYAYNDGEWSREAHFAAVAIPIYCEDQLLGGLNMIFPKDTVDAEQLKKRFLPALERLAKRIGKDAKAWLN